MSDNTKRIIEKKGQGEYDFTAYGEFLAYFHAHIDIFKKILKSKNTDPAQVEAIVKSAKAYMTANIKKTDHFFEHLPQFATLLGVKQEEISAYLNTNFIDVLSRVKDKLKSQELEKLENAPDISYDRITEEITERLKFVFPPDFRFVEKGILLVLENSKTGEMIEPQGLMAESAKAALAVAVSPDEKSKPASLTEALTQANAPPPPPVKKQSLVAEKEKSILVEIIELHGQNLTGEKLEINLGPPVSENQAEDTTKTATKKDDYEIEDLEFEGESESPSASTSDSSSQVAERDDFDDLLDSTPALEEDPEEEEDPFLVTCESYTLKEYIDLTAIIASYQQKADQVGYQNWLRGLGEFEKTLVSLRTSLLKEQKGETVSWEQSFQGIVAKTQFKNETLVKLLVKLRNFQWVKMTLDRAIVELKKGSPEFVNLVRMAWPHIQKAFFDVPNFEQVQKTLKGILSRVNDEAHRKEFTRIFTMALNFIQSKYKV
jgi:hypothetical protein